MELIRLALAEGKVLPPVEGKDAPVPETKEEELPGQMSIEEPAPVEEVPCGPGPETPAEEPVKTVGLSDIQKKVVELSAAGKKSAVRDVITKYASRVSAIPADKTAEVWEQLTALEG
jgi:hypothetical protein